MAYTQLNVITNGIHLNVSQWPAIRNVWAIKCLMDVSSIVDQIDGAISGHNQIMHAAQAHENIAGHRNARAIERLEAGKS